MADRTIFGSDVDGGMFVGDAGPDKLTLMGGGNFNFRLATLSGYDSIVGSDKPDTIFLNTAQLADVQFIDGVANSSSGGNGLKIYGTAIDLRDKVVSNISWIDIFDDGATLSTKDYNVAMALSAYYSQNDTLILENVTLSEANLRTLHDQGVDTIKNGDGTTSIDAAPVIVGLDETPRTLDTGETVFIDIGSNAQVSDDFGGIKSMYFTVTAPNDPNGFNSGRVLLSKTDRVSFSSSMYNEGSVYVDGVEVATYESGGYSHGRMSFKFKLNVTQDQMSALVGSLKYQASPSKLFNVVEVDLKIEAYDVGSRRATQTMKFNIPSNASVDPDMFDPYDPGPHTPDFQHHEPLNYGPYHPEIVVGTARNDTFSGNLGNNRLYGREGRDTLTGKAGKDIFVFDTKLNKTTNVDKITDFNVKDDSIWLDNKVFTKLGKGTDAKPGKLNKKFFSLDKAKDKDDYVLYDAKKGVLSYDMDGSGAKAAVAFATLKKGLKMTAADFFVV